MQKLLLIGSSRDVLEAKRVVLEGAGYVVQVLEPGGSARRAAEQMGASAIVIDVAAGGPGVRAALDELSAAGAPSSIPVLVIGPADALVEYDGTATSIGKPAAKRALLDSTRTLLRAAPKPWSKKKTAF